MFNQSVIEQLKFYVYFLRDPRNGQVFYVGKGKENRIFNHVECDLKTERISDKIKIIKDIASAGYKVEHFILRHGLDESSAFEIEAALIDFIGISNLSNLQSGHHSFDFGIKTTDEIKAIYNSSELETDEPLLLININKLYNRDMTESELYEATRKYWVVGSRRNSAKYAIATYRGLTREVYKINSWSSIETNGKIRWEFKGHLASDKIRDSLKYKSISNYFKKGSANPIRYINC